MQSKELLDIYHQQQELSASIHIPKEYNPRIIEEMSSLYCKKFAETPWCQTFSQEDPKKFFLDASQKEEFNFLYHQNEQGKLDAFMWYFSTSPKKLFDDLYKNETATRNSLIDLFKEVPKVRYLSECVIGTTTIEASRQFYEKLKDNNHILVLRTHVEAVGILRPTGKAEFIQVAGPSIKNRNEFVNGICDPSLPENVWLVRAPNYTELFSDRYSEIPQIRKIKNK